MYRLPHFIVPLTNGKVTDGHGYDKNRSRQRESNGIVMNKKSNRKEIVTEKSYNFTVINLKKPSWTLFLDISKLFSVTFLRN